MDIPICFSNYFVNKQSLRSFSNVVKSKYFKNQDNGNAFTKFLLEDNDLVCNTSKNFVFILDELRNNLRNNCKQEFKQYFTQFKYPKNMSTVDKKDVFLGCINALGDIVPKSLYGGKHNYKIFKRIVQEIIYTMNKQHIFYTIMLKSWDLTVSPWQTLPSHLSCEILNKILHWIMKYLLSAIISLNFYVTTCKLDSDDNKLHFFKKEHWQSFHDKMISGMILTKIIHKYDQTIMKNGVSTKNNLQERLKLQILRKQIPKLHLFLKQNNNCRAIVCLYGHLGKTEKYKIKEKLLFLKMLNGTVHEKLEKQYSNLYSTWLQKCKPKLYFIKTDLSNAFGSINKEQLLKILYEQHLKFQKTEKCLYIKKKFAQNFKEVTSELQKPLLIRVGSTIYEWKEGLVQGYKFSPALSELYYTYMDKLYFKEHMNSNESLLKMFVRVVDDYLYITDSIKDAHLFLEALSNYHNVNYNKTFVNFHHKLIKYSNKITFLGHCYDTATLSVSRADNIYRGQMCYKITFSHAIVNLHKFLATRIGLSSIQINCHIFNLHYNNEKTVWQHIFITLCLAANKFCTILAIVCENSEIEKYFIFYKEKVTVKLCNSMIEVLMKNKPHNYNFVYCINHFRYLSYKALYLCAKITPKCNSLVPVLKSELSKSNCIHGKWKEHARIIDRNGQIFQQAVREVCKRPDLKIIMKKFDSLPIGFECYRNHQK
ncbi:unnamed protein product [Parnassius mnemosyne]|uniref:Telomerase reverse transcriptase n=1 Tax=Parnassius mnemosyne TaxID=213953 RepID=A0AAV1LGM3_9NEOP